jgi:hypothetical protein
MGTDVAEHITEIGKGVNAAQLAGGDEAVDELLIRGMTFDPLAGQITPTPVPVPLSQPTIRPQTI